MLLILITASIERFAACQISQAIRIGKTSLNINHIVTVKIIFVILVFSIIILITIKIYERDSAKHSFPVCILNWLNCQRVKKLEKFMAWNQ